MIKPQHGWGWLGLAVCCLLACAPTKQIVKSETWVQTPPPPTLTQVPSQGAVPPESATPPTLTPTPVSRQGAQSGSDTLGFERARVAGGTKRELSKPRPGTDPLALQLTAVVIPENPMLDEKVAEVIPTPGAFWTPTPIPALRAGTDESSPMGGGTPGNGESSRRGISVTRVFIGTGLFLLIAGIVVWFKQVRDRQPRREAALVQDANSEGMRTVITPKPTEGGQTNAATIEKTDAVTESMTTTETLAPTAKPRVQRRRVTTTVKIQKTVKVQSTAKKAPKRAALRMGKPAVKTVRLDSTAGVVKRKRRPAA